MDEKNLFVRARICLAATDPDEKVRLTHEVADAWRQGRLSLEPTGKELDIAGRPERPVLVQPRELARRSPNSVEGRAVLFHALVHIEFNAINLAWDAVQRFCDLPGAYYSDWIRVADEEALHFDLLRAHLRSLGYEYGDFPAHNGLWEMARTTAHDPLARMALVPRCIEARGLDVNPGIKAKLLAHGDNAGADLLDIILRDEIGHVAIGDRWFRHLCVVREVEPATTYRELIDQYMRGSLKGPFHIEARRAAGFGEDELAELQRVGGNVS